MENKKVLVVDDDEKIADLIVKHLEYEGFNVARALSGQEAVSKAKMFLPDLILMDIILPDMDGSEVVKQLRKGDDTRFIAVIFLSGIISREKDVPDSDVQVGGESYPALPKPFTIQQLLNKIHQVLENFS